MESINCLHCSLPLVSFHCDYARCNWLKCSYCTSIRNNRRGFLPVFGISVADGTDHEINNLCEILYDAESYQE